MVSGLQENQEENPRFLPHEEEELTQHWSRSILLGALAFGAAVQVYYELIVIDSR